MKAVCSTQTITEWKEKMKMLNLTAQVAFAQRPPNLTRF